jgi:HEAT repeat protein
MFYLTMIKLSILVLLLSGTGAFAAEKKRPAAAPVKVIVKTDEAAARERETRLSEIYAIEKATGAAGVSALKPLLSDKSREVRGEAAEAMGKTKAPAAFDELSSAITSADENLRWGAVSGLAALGDKRAVPLLTKALGHPEINTRWKAALALGQLKDPQAVDALVNSANDDKSKNVRLTAIEALMNIGGGKAAVALEILSYDPDPEVKTWAAAAAKKLQGKK